jgi:hypothetical protein
MLQRWLRQLVVTMLLAALAPLAGGQTVSNIRVMLHPYAADPGKLPDATLAQLQTLAGQPLTLAEDHPDRRPQCTGAAVERRRPCGVIAERAMTAALLGRRL